MVRDHTDEWFAKLCEGEYKHVKALCNYLVRTSGVANLDPEDIAQQVFYIALRRSADLCTRENPRAFLFKTAKWVHLDMSRKKRRQAAYEEFEADSDMFLEIPDPARVAEPDDMRAEILDEASRNLGRKDYILYQQTYLLHMSKAQLMQFYDLSDAAIRTKLTRLRKKLIGAIGKMRNG